MERDDSANLFVLEGVLIALILMGAAYTVQSLQQPASEAVRPRTELARLTNDVLVVLNGLHDGNGSSLLDLYLAQQWHCAHDAVPSPHDCELRRSKNLSLKVENFLPLGAGWAIEIGNGADTRELYRSPMPQGEAVASSLSFGPEWNLTFVTTEFSCYEAGTDINLTLLPIDRGVSPWTRWGNVTIGAAETEGKPHTTPRWWNATLAGATRPASATVVANVTGNATLRGSTSYAACDLQGKSAELRDALLATTFAAPSTAPIGGSAAFVADLASLQSIAGVSLLGASVTVHEPLPALNGTPDSYLEAARIDLVEGALHAGTWEVAPATLYGTHPVVLRVSLDVGGTSLELRRVTALDIALASGEVPIDPPYRVMLQTWLPDWG